MEARLLQSLHSGVLRDGCRCLTGTGGLGLCGVLWVAPALAQLSSVGGVPSTSAWGDSSTWLWPLLGLFYMSLRSFPLGVPG